MHFFFLFVMLVGLCETAQADDQVYELDYDGAARRYIVHTPPSFDKRGELPVVLALHGGGGSGEKMLGQSEVNKTADKYGFIAVYPEGTGGKFHTWNAGTCCGKAQKNDVDDVGYISEVIDQVEKRYNINEKRVYVVGLSNGAMMSYRLSCELSDKITAIAPIAAQITFEPCLPKRAVPTLHIHGTKDKCALYEGGECGGCFANLFKGFGLFVPKTMWTCDSVPKSVSARAKAFGCDENSGMVYQKGDVKCQRWKNCNDDAEVELCTVEGGGHNLPGSTFVPQSCRSRPNGVMCKRRKDNMGHVTQDINTNEAMWAFFMRHTL